MAKEPSATLHDVARHLGVSHVTVWRALRGSPKVSEPRRIEIQQIAEQMGDRPNPNAAALVQIRKSLKSPPASIQASIAWRKFWALASQLREVELFNAQWNGACRAAKTLGYRIEEFICD